MRKGAPACIIGGMKITLEQLKSYVKGAYSVTERDGFLAFERLSERQRGIISSVAKPIITASLVNASVRMEFITDAENLSLSYRLSRLDTDMDTIDIYCNGAPSAVFTLRDMPESGVMEVNLPKGEKEIIIYMPSDSAAEIGGLCVDGNIRQTEKKPRVLVMGDSITQGYGPYMTGYTYVNVLSRELGYDVLNQGIGGYYYDEKFVERLENFVPEKIIIAMGTNQHNSPDRAARVQKFYLELKRAYPQTPVLAVTPIWRCDGGTNMPALTALAQIIKKECAKYKNIRVADGFDLVPNDGRYFKDGLHPNATGMLLYALNLKKVIEKLGF